MPNDKKNTPRPEKKSAPARDRQAAKPAARRKKPESEERSSAPIRERKSTSTPSRSRRTEGDQERNTSPIREKRTPSAAPRSKRTEGGEEKSPSSARERRPASFSPRTKKSEGGEERSASPPRERRPASFSPRTKKSEGEGERTTSPIREKRAPATGDREKRAPYVRGKQSDTPGDKHLVFPREARRYINVYLGLGSNMGNRRAQIQAAINLISDQIGKIAKKSHLYETQPWGMPHQDMYLNQVIMINTMLDPRDLLKEVLFIEQELGRVRVENEKWGPRTIDIDILFYGKRVLRNKGLEIPHPELHQRGFVLVPLMEIAPDLEHPVLKQQIDELYMVCEDQSEVIMLDS